MARETKIINLFGGPGVGKSTVAAGLFYEMKIAGCEVENASEWIKDKVYEGTKYPFQDQLYTFAKQNKKLKQMVGKVDYIICDSPIFLSLVYQSQELPVFSKLVLDYFNSYDNINFVIRRHHLYKPTGRVHTERQADIISSEVEVNLDKYKIKYDVVRSGDAVYKILELIGIKRCL